MKLLIVLCGIILLSAHSKADENNKVKLGPKVMLSKSAETTNGPSSYQIEFRNAKNVLLSKLTLSRLNKGILTLKGKTVAKIMRTADHFKDGGHYYEIQDENGDKLASLSITVGEGYDTYKTLRIYHDLGVKVAEIVLAGERLDQLRMFETDTYSISRLFPSEVKEGEDLIQKFEGFVGVNYSKSVALDPRVISLSLIVGMEELTE